MSDPTHHIFGIRHHGPGSARSLRAALQSVKPDIVLIEGPPDAAEILPLAANQEMKPPVAILVYAADDPRKAVYYPFAVFSPEWQAIQYALERDVPVRFMDLPQANRMAPPGEEAERAELPPGPLRRDPLGALAEAAGYGDGEQWWEHVIEQRRDGADVFAAVLEAMKTVRTSSEVPDDPEDLLREAHMRQTIRAAQKEGFARVAIVCGAWHAPVLAEMPDPKDDAARLKGLAKVKVNATWVPWTYGRLTYASGYGAGVRSPGWYQHLWSSADQVPVRWMTRVARLLRDQDIDCSSAHVIESVRLAESLSALRGRSLPDLSELNDAARAVFCFDSDLPMRLISEKLVVGERLGEVAQDAPAVPLQQDLQREQRRLRMQPDASAKTLDLDLRKETDLDRSRLLHRLRLLGIPWGDTKDKRGAKGTFHEIWTLQWDPGFVVTVIEAGVWGNTIDDATAAFAKDAADKAQDLPRLTRLLDQVLLAELPDAMSRVMQRLEAEAALASDIGHLMDALPPLANVLRYGNVRQTDTTMVAHVVSRLVARVCVNLPAASASLNDEAAGEMFARIVGVHGAVSLLENPEHTKDWQAALRRLADSPGIHGLIAGRAVRLLLDAAAIPGDEAAKRLSLALSTASEPAHAAAWVEGLLRGSGLLLLHDDALWNVLDEWIARMHADAFVQLLPLLRRTFSTFEKPERRQMGERAKRGGAVGKSAGQMEAGYDAVRADAVVPLLARLLGL